MKRYVFLVGVVVAALLHVTTWFSVTRIFEGGSGQPRGLVAKGDEMDNLKREENSESEAVDWRTPTMHTFFEPVPGGCCGTTQEGHQRLLRTWESAWRSKGWETKILKEEDARKHQDFEKLKGILDRLEVDDYNRRCFYRWLAMSEIGGWMSDYDTFPLNFDAEVGSRLQQYGEFTSLESHIPSLIQANKKEWERVTQLMIEMLEFRKDDGFISDMFILEKIKKTMGKKAGRFARPKTLVVPGLPYAYNKIENENDRKLYCGALKDKLAIHFSHASTAEAFIKGKFPIKSGISNIRDAMERRSSAATIMLEDYEDQCPHDGGLEIP